MIDMKFSWSGLVFLMIFLYLGGLLSAFIMPFFGSPTGYYGGFITGIIQVLILAIFGVLVSVDLMKIIIGAVMILLGGLFGGIIAETLGLVGFSQTIVILALQSIMLMATGLTKEKPSSQIG